MNKKQRLRSSMAANIIGAVVMLLIVFGIIVSAIGLAGFTRAFKREYDVSTFHMADTATLLVNGDHLDEYLAGEETEEYLRTKENLDDYCRTISVSLVYVIDVDRSDYGRFVSIFNSVDNEVDDSEYSAWELGHRRDTTNDEYRRKYRAIYEQDSPYETVYRRKYRAIYEQDSPYETVYRLKTTDGQHPHITTLVPVRDSSGEVAAILCMQRPVREVNDARARYLMDIVIMTVILALISSAFIVLYIRRNFVRPIRRISDEAVRFARENTKGEQLGGVSRFGEISRLAGSIDTMETDMVEYMENLTSVTAEKERIGAELSLANTIQSNSIPNVFPAFPDRSDFDIYASMDPAKEVGGDFYNFFLIDDDHLAMSIGDVSGKGIPAALFMMVTNILVSDRTSMGGGPAEILQFVNENLCAHNKAEMFVTVWLGILELSTGRLTAANAGHEYPAVKRGDGRFELLKDRHGFVLGGLSSSKYTEYELQMEPGDKVFVYTDGVPEAANCEEEMFGTERMLAALNAQASAPPEHILANVRSAVDNFVKDAEQFDDLTMLCVEYKGKDMNSDDDRTDR